MAPALAPPPAAAAAEATAADPRLEELRVAALGRLTGQFAHELRNALTGLRCYLDLAQGAEVPPAAAGYVREMGEGVERVANLSAQWLDLAHGRSASSHANVEIHRIFEVLRAIGCSRRVRLQEDLDPALGLGGLPARSLQAVLFVLVQELVGRKPRGLVARTAREGDHTVIELTITGGDASAAPAVQLGALPGGATLETRSDGYRLVLPPPDEGDDEDD